MRASYKEIYRIVNQIPRGRVATYGQVARLVGIPGHARQVGYALSAMADDQPVVWHRVINARGEISTRSEPEFEQLQRKMLEAEGIVFDERDRVSLQRYRWQQNDRQISG